MGGGIMQLVAYGAQDIYLTGNPQITFFKVVYRRHTNFSMETINQNISGQSFIGIDNINNKATVTISRNGDLVTGVFITAKQTDANNTVGLCGDNIVEDVEIEIGGQRIDKHYKDKKQQSAFYYNEHKKQTIDILYYLRRSWPKARRISNSN